MNRIATIALFILFGAALRAVEPDVSPAFRFDARYAASGVTPALWAANEAYGLSSLFALRTRPLFTDTDGDGMPDFYESAHGLNPLRNDADGDADGDGRTNREEYNAGTNPAVADDWSKASNASEVFLVDNRAARPEIHEEEVVEVWSRSLRFLVDTAGRAKDSDGDGMPDWWELLSGLNPYRADANEDADGDGRTNREEWNAGTNPAVRDDWTKGADASEAFVADTRVLYVGGQPIAGEVFAVYRVSNVFVCDTGGLYYDWDGDGIPNWWEARFSRGGSKTALDASSDADGDGMTALQEFIAYTDPTNSASFFMISIESAGSTVLPIRTKSQTLRKTATTEPADGFAISWQTAKGRIYQILSTDSLIKGWNDEPVAVIEGTGEKVSVPVDQTGPARFFRVTVDLSP